jgi:hypothetical protein
MALQSVWKCNSVTCCAGTGTGDEVIDVKATKYESYNMIPGKIIHRAGLSLIVVKKDNDT